MLIKSPQTLASMLIPLETLPTSMSSIGKKIRSASQNEYDSNMQQSFAMPDLGLPHRGSVLP